MAKYEDEYRQFDRDEFVRVVSKKYKVSESTAYRTWYKLKAVLPSITPKPKVKPREILVPKDIEEQKDDGDDELVKSQPIDAKGMPDKFKMLRLQDLMWFKKGFLTRSVLRTHGFNDAEITWLVNSGFNININQ
jgi:hypothetical protein